MKKYIAELIGTFALVFCGTGAIVINDLTNGTVSHLGIAITFGLIRLLIDLKKSIYSDILLLNY